MSKTKRTITVTALNGTHSFRKAMRACFPIAVLQEVEPKQCACCGHWSNRLDVFTFRAALSKREVQSNLNTWADANNCFRFSFISIETTR